jgi:hypothetical protein
MYCGFPNVTKFLKKALLISKKVENKIKEQNRILKVKLTNPNVVIVDTKVKVGYENFCRTRWLQ